MPSFIADLKSSSLFSHENTPLYTFVDQNNSVLEELLNKHAPLKEKVVVELPTQQQWITEDILAAKQERHKSEKIYRKTGLKSDRETYRRSCEKVKDLRCKAKAKYYQDKVEQCEGDQKKLFEIVDSLLGRGKCKSLPPNEDAFSLAEAFSEFFITKIQKIRDILSELSRLPKR